MAKIDLMQNPYFAGAVRAISANKTLFFIGSAYAAILLFLRSSAYAPIPFGDPLNTTPDWASWFDAYLTFPILTILCLLPFRSSRRGTLVLVALIAVIPTYLIFASYYFYYAQSPLGLWVLVTPLTLIVPTLILIAILAAPTIGSLILAENLTRAEGTGIRLRFPERSRVCFIAIATVSVALALTQALLRSSANGIALTGWVSDIGITVEAGARYLVGGINPYTHGLPPWGGAGTTYGPIAYLMVAPFVFLPEGWAAHVGALFYAVATSMGIWKCMRLLSPKVASYCALVFLALPTTSWAIESGTTLHLIASVLIVWSLYMFLSGHHFWAGFTGALGLLAIFVPGALIVPYLLASKNNRERLRATLGFLAPVILVVGTVVAVFPAGFLLQEVGGIATYQLGRGWLTLNLLFSPAFSLVVSLILTGWLAFWFIYRSFKMRQDNPQLLATITVFLLLLPFVAANYFAYFYVWGSAVALVAIFSRLRVGEDPSGTNVSAGEV